MNSLHNLDRSIDKFLAWLSEAESSVEGLETDVDRLGSKREATTVRLHNTRLKVSFFHLNWMIYDKSATDSSISVRLFFFNPIKCGCFDVYRNG